MKPSEKTGRVPTRSTCTWLKRRWGMLMGWAGAAGCLVTLARWHCWHDLHQAARSDAMPCQTTRADANLLVARVLGWAKPWMAVKTDWHSSTGIRGQTWPVEMSQSSWTPSWRRAYSWRDEETAVDWTLVHVLAGRPRHSSQSPPEKGRPQRSIQGKQLGAYWMKEKNWAWTKCRPPRSANLAHAGC